MPMYRMIRLLAAGTLLASALVLGGCSSTIADMQGIGLPSDAPARAKEAGGYAACDLIAGAAGRPC